MTVKAYLIGKEDCNKEIRRFAVDQDVSTSFEYLKRKVIDVFIGLGNAPFQMHYKGKSDIHSGNALQFLNFNTLTWWFNKMTILYTYSFVTFLGKYIT